MTHSHDTPTPAMSDETVTSEEFVLVPREPTKAMIAGGLNVDLSDEDEIASIYNVYHAMIAAAPTLSASHLAKEGGEAGAVGYLNRLVLADFDPNGTEIVSAMLYPKGTLHPQNEVAIYALPHPSPALAKEGEGAEAILWQEKRGVWKRPGAIVKHVRMSSGHMAWRATFDDGRHHHSDSADDAKAYADGFLAREQAEAFSTPTEGPASQTEGMGGDEGGAARLQLLLNMRDKFIVDAGLWEVFVASDASKGVGAWDQAPALTPPETAEAIEELREEIIVALWGVNAKGESSVDPDDFDEKVSDLLKTAIRLLAGKTLTIPPETAEAVPVADEEAERAAFDAWWTQSGRKGEYDVLAGQAAYIAWRERASDPEAARLREELERESEESYEIGKRDGYGEAVQHIDQRTGGDGEYCCVVGYDADDRHCPDPQTMIVRIVGRFESLAGQTNSANQERDDAAKALESVTEELGLFRDFVINNATVWTLGSNHHHPIWARVADRLEGYTSPRDGEKWHLVRAAAASDPAPATDDRERLVAIIELFVSRIERNGSWDDGCFYFNGRAASELERPLKMARAVLRASREAQPATDGGDNG